MLLRDEMVKTSRFRVVALSAMLLETMSSCKGSHTGGGSGAGGTGTDGPPPAPPPVPAGDESLDDTAGGGATPACLSHPLAHESRNRYQCAGRLRATLSLDVTVSGIAVDQDPVPIDKEFGHGEPDDEYSDPLVMACCTTPTEPFCSSSASQSCHVDLIQTSCQSLPQRIHEKADEQALPGPKEALHALADHIGGHQEECRASFGLDAVEATDPACLVGGESSYGSLLAGRKWAIQGTFSGGTTDITNVVIAVDEASMAGIFPADSVGVEGCWSLEDNDDTPHFRRIFPTRPLVESP
jgi:hypothetical protein